MRIAALQPFYQKHTPVREWQRRTSLLHFEWMFLLLPGPGVSDLGRGEALLHEAAAQVAFVCVARTGGDIGEAHLWDFVKERARAFHTLLHDVLMRCHT